MKKFLKQTTVVALACFALAQLVPVHRSNPPASHTIQAPSEILAILQNACFDCHSHETDWPPYAFVAPISWFVAHDVNEGRMYLNFSAWDQLSPQLQKEQILEIYDVIEAGQMPPTPYRLLHHESTIQPSQLQTIKSWAQQPTPIATPRNHGVEPALFTVNPYADQASAQGSVETPRQEVP